MTNQTYFTKETDSKSYATGYDVFLSRTNFREKILAHLKASVARYLPHSPVLNVLDIGCGNGQMTKKYLTSISDKSFNVNLLEPSKTALDLASNEVKAMAQELYQLNESADSYFKASNHSSKYDLIIASYVFYHLSPEIIPNVIDSLRENGVFVIMMGGKEHPLRQHSSLRALSKHGDSSKLKDILEELKNKSKISVNVESIKTDLDLNGLWNNSELTSDGEKFFSFIYNEDISNFSKENLSALNSTLSEIFRQDGGIAHPTHEIIWVTKL